MNDSNIQAFIHCSTCGAKGRSGRYEVGLTDPFTIRVWCAKCQKLVADFTLAKSIQPRCDVCGESIGPDHVH
jgi:ribosomal protein S27E